MKKFLEWIRSLLLDQRGVIGDADPDDDDSGGGSDDDEGQGGSSDDDDDDVLSLGDDDDDDDNDEEKKKEKEAEAQRQKEFKELQAKVDKLEQDKKNLNTALHQERQARKKPGAGQELSEAELKQILEDNPNDPEVQLNVVKYLAERAATGKATEAVSAAEVTKKKRELDTFLLERYPDISDPASETRVEVEEAKRNFGLQEHPYGDFFAVASKVLEDLPDLLEQAYNDGLKGKKKTDAEKKRVSNIEGNKPASSKDSSAKPGKLTDGQKDTANQMGLSGNALKAYKKIVGKKASTVSVEGGNE